MNFPFTIHCAGGAITVVVLSFDRNSIPLDVGNWKSEQSFGNEWKWRDEKWTIFSDELQKCAFAAALEFVKWIMKKSMFIRRFHSSLSQERRLLSSRLWWITLLSHFHFEIITSANGILTFCTLSRSFSPIYTIPTTRVMYISQNSWAYVVSLLLYTHRVHECSKSSQVNSVLSVCVWGRGEASRRAECWEFILESDISEKICNSQVKLSQVLRFSSVFSWVHLFVREYGGGWRWRWRSLVES